MYSLAMSINMISSIDNPQRDWFPYQNGFVNVDHENVYLTNSGNWSETEKLQEKSKKRWNFRAIRMRLTIVIAGIVLMMVLFYVFAKKGLKIGFGVELVLIFLAIYDSFRTETGGRYKIPRNKISDIETEDNWARIQFINGDEKEDAISLDNIKSNGVQILQSLGKTKRVAL